MNKDKEGLLLSEGEIKKVLDEACDKRFGIDCYYNREKMIAQAQLSKAQSYYEAKIKDCGYRKVPELKVLDEEALPDVPLCSNCHSVITVKQDRYGLTIECNCASSSVDYNSNKRWSAPAIEE